MKLFDETFEEKLSFVFIFLPDSTILPSTCFPVKEIKCKESPFPATDIITQLDAIFYFRIITIDGGHLLFYQ